MTGSHARALPTVVLVGRPNVGKSTLFNRITRTRRAIVNAMAGTTRDVMAHDAEWLGMSFRLVDTGGIFGHTEDPLHDLVVEHGKRAILQADLVIFVVDGREGRVSGDDEIAAEIRRVAQAPVLLAVNKADDKRARDRMYEFFAFGFDHVFEIAAEHGTGVHDLMDAVQGQLKAAGKIGRRGGGGDARRDCGRDRRPAQRRQVVAREPAAPRGAADRQRHPRHHARRHRHAAALAQAHVPHRRHRGHQPTRAASRVRTRWRW